MTKLIQTENYPTGDCMRTVFACMLNKANPDEVPNFMRDGEKTFYPYMESWLTENDLEWIELDYEDWKKTPSVPLGICGITGKSPRGDYDHIVVGDIRHRSEDEKNFRDIYFTHDTSPAHDGAFIEGDIKLIGFLLRKLN